MERSIWTGARRGTLVAAALVAITGPAAAGGADPRADSGVARVAPVERVERAAPVRRIPAAAPESLRRDPRADSGGRWIPGPLATQYARDGVAPASAISLARDAGETPSFVSGDPVRTRAARRS